MASSYEFLSELESLSTPKILNEGLVGIEVLMIINEVCKARKFTNPVQMFMFAKLVMALKNGSVTTIPELASAVGIETPSSVINAVRQLTDEHVAALADFLANVFSYRDKEFVWPAHYVDASLCASDWIMKYVIQSTEESRD